MTKRDAIIKLLNGERVRKRDWLPRDFICLNKDSSPVDQNGEPFTAPLEWDLMDLNDDDWELYSGPRFCKFSELYDLLKPGNHATYSNNNTKAIIRLFEDGHREILLKCGEVIKSSISLEELQATWTIHRGGKE